MARTAKGGLSEHPKHGFRLTIGKKPDGKPRLFWLGRNRAIAEHHATLLRATFYEGMRKENPPRDIWTDADLEKVNWWVGYFKRSVLKAKQQYQAGLAELEEARQELEEERAEYASVFGEIDQPETA